MNKPVFYIASVVIVAKGFKAPVYYVTTNAGTSSYCGFDNLPELVKDWIDCHNNDDSGLVLFASSGSSVTLLADALY